MPQILVLNGPNLNMLGTREPKHYGRLTLSDIQHLVEEEANALGCMIDFRQSNAEHELIGWIQDTAQDDTDFVVINPAAFTHTSVAIRDALSAAETPFIEVHLSNVHAREPFRHHSYLSDIAVGVIAGLGAMGYVHAVRSANEFLENTRTSSH